MTTPDREPAGAAHGTGDAEAGRVPATRTLRRDVKLIAVVLLVVALAVTWAATRPTARAPKPSGTVPTARELDGKAFRASSASNGDGPLRLDPAGPALRLVFGSDGAVTVQALGWANHAHLVDGRLVPAADWVAYRVDLLPELQRQDDVMRSVLEDRPAVSLAGDVLRLVAGPRQVTFGVDHSVPTPTPTSTTGG